MWHCEYDFTRSDNNVVIFVFEVEFSIEIARRSWVHQWFMVSSNACDCRGKTHSSMRIQYYVSSRYM